MGASELSSSSTESLSVRTAFKASRRQREFVWNAVGYHPTPEQAAIHFADLAEPGLREKWVSGGEQSGKSFSAEKELLSRLAEGPLYWLAGSDYDNCRREFEYLLADSDRLGWTLEYSFPKEGQCSIRLIGNIVVKTISLKDFHKIGKESPNGIIICEAAQVDWEAVLRCRSRVGASRGWLYPCGTMEGSLGWFGKTVKQYQLPNNDAASTFVLPSWSNIHTYPLGRNDPEILRLERLLPQDKFLERLAGVPCPTDRLIMREFSDSNVLPIQFDASRPVDLAIDPGGAFKAGAYCVLAIQERGDFVDVVDEVYLRGYVSEDIIDICKTKLWWANVKGGVIDIASKAHRTEARKDMPSDHDIWFHRAGVYLRTNPVEEASGIEVMRSFLKIDPVFQTPHLLVSPNCRGLIAECGGGVSPLHDGGAWLRDKEAWKPIDRNNHACKAMIYWLVDKRGYVRGEGVQEQNFVQSMSPFG